MSPQCGVELDGSKTGHGGQCRPCGQGLGQYFGGAIGLPPRLRQPAMRGPNHVCTN